MVIAPPAPVAWSPGTPPLTGSLRARVLAGAGSAAERAIEVLPASGRRVVAVPVDTAVRWIVGDHRGTTRIAVPVGYAARTSVAPWGEPDPVPGVVMRTDTVPSGWLRSATSRPNVPVATAVIDEPRRMPLPRPMVRREPRPMPTSMRIRRAAMMAFGLLVSLVAVEAAARVGRR
jgi:hypothetical protein